MVDYRGISVEGVQCREHGLKFTDPQRAFEETGKCIFQSINPKACNQVLFSGNTDSSSSIKLYMSADWSKFADRPKAGYKFVASVPDEQLDMLVKCLRSGIKKPQTDEFSVDGFYGIDADTREKYENIKLGLELFLILTPGAFTAKLASRFLAPRIPTFTRWAMPLIQSRAGSLAASNFGRGAIAATYHFAEDPHAFADPRMHEVASWFENGNNTFLTSLVVGAGLGIVHLTEKKLGERAGDFAGDAVFSLGLALHHYNNRSNANTRNSSLTSLQDYLIAGLESREAVPINAIVVGFAGGASVERLGPGAKTACLFDDTAGAVETAHGEE